MNQFQKLTKKWEKKKKKKRVAVKYLRSAKKIVKRYAMMSNLYDLCQSARSTSVYSQQELILI